MSDVLVIETEIAELVVTSDPTATVLETGGSAVEVTNQVTELAVYDESASVLEVIESGPQTIIQVGAEEVEYAKRVDFITDDEFYKGEAAAGSADSAAAWRIQHTVIGVDGDVDTKWADGNTNFDNVWDDRLTLSYS